MARRKSRKDHRKRGGLPRRLFRRARGPAVPPGTRVVYEPAGREKMSGVLEDFVEPYRDATETLDDFRKLLSLASVAWNAALLPEGQRPAMIDQMVEAGFSRADESDRAWVRQLIESMVRRKQEHFAENRRAIVSFELTDTGDDYHLSVASTL